MQFFLRFRINIKSYDFIIYGNTTIEWKAICYQNIHFNNLNGKLHRKIELKDICIKYLSIDSLSLDNLSFTIIPGKYVAFVGESQCGKL